MRTHQTLTNDTYQRWRESAQILERDAHGDKVLQLDDGRILKLFRIKSRWSSAQWLPYSGRFARHARRLTDRGVPTVTPVALYRLNHPPRSAVLYDPLPGDTLRDLGARGRIDPALAEAIGGFIQQLHARGILFRSLHLGNIIRCPDGGFGLIDIADMVIRPWSLTVWQRLRNFQHFLRYADNRDVLNSQAAQSLVNGYLNACALPPRRLATLTEKLDALLVAHESQTGIA